MALLVIVCGALLMIGGAISLLMGFDIVMTERGSAMTLGGVIALSGGVVAVGIGFALLRLSQILAALESRNPKGAARTAPPDRPVVPLGGVEPPAPAGDEQPAKTGSGMGGMAVAGVAAGAAVAAGGLAWAKKTDAEPVSIPAEPDLSGLAPVAANAPEPMPVVQTPLKDLEDELSRALAEPFGTPTRSIQTPEPVIDPPEDVSAEPPSAEAQPASTFAGGLSELLAKPRGRRRKPVGPDVSADDAAPDVQAAVEEPVAVDTVAGDALATAVAELDEPPEAAADAGDDKGATVDEVPAPEDAGYKGAEAAPEAEREQETPSSDEVPPQPGTAMRAEVPRAKVLGTYNAGGRTYSMFADGSVEAITESGIERFESMEALRRHLTERSKTA